ncbi:MAG: lipopolysaccharide biosynthesis protein [Rhodanobacteraceae bacterium]|nr:MAG: lipopolysaccharide biosynthesis protein [Rhodanobacteraceae bacterium]
MRLLHISNLRGPIARGTIRTTGVLGLRLVVQAGTLLLVARMLGPDQFGAFAGVAALAVILGTLSTFGTHLVLLGEVSKEPAHRTQVLPYAVPSTLLCGGVLFALYLLITTFALPEIGVAFTVLVAIGVTETLLQPLFTLPAMEHLALGRIARSQLLQTLPLALRLAAAASVFLLQTTDPLAAYSYGYFAASLIALAIATLTMPAPWPATKTWRLPTRAEVRETAGYAALAITATSPAELDKTLATKLLPLGGAGLYAAGARVIGAATLPVIAMMLSALPRLFREGQNQPKRTARLLRWIFVATVGYSVALAVAIWFIAPVFVWLFGSKYQGIEHTIHWLTLAVPGMSLRFAAGGVLMALGKPWMRVGFEIVGLTVLVVAAIMLAPHLDPAGMPLALACSEWVMTLLGWAMVRSAIKSPTTRPRLPVA